MCILRLSCKKSCGPVPPPQHSIIFQLILWSVVLPPTARRGQRTHASRRVVLLLYFNSLLPPSGSVHPRTHRSDWEELSSTDSLLSPPSLWRKRIENSSDLVGSLQDSEAEPRHPSLTQRGKHESRSHLVSDGAQFPQQRGFLGVDHVVFRLLPLSQGAAVGSRQLTLLVG